MTPSEFTNFLDAGAILRVSEDDWFLLKGPFRNVEKTTPGQVTLFTPDFFIGPNPSYWLPAGFSRLKTADLRILCELFNNHDPQKPLEWLYAEPQNFHQSYAKVMDRIEKATLVKAVPIEFERSDDTIDGQRIVGMLQSLLSAPGTLFVYGFWQNGRGSLGASPEILLRQDGNILSTMALAGTSPKQDAQRVSLLSDAKELYEHELVAKDIESVLSAYGTVTIVGPKILELPTLLHLKSDIQCRLRDPLHFNFFDACVKLHPTPALGVSPRSAGYDWLKELPEQQTRDGFGAPWGLRWGPNDALCLVAIRNLQWNESGSRIGSGCGIVQQSQFEQERRELSQKRQSVKKILGLQS
ncbi:MAG: chorismate-binding protein [Bdellovibrionaceae bacterium]|nr:chorismate-binding protein [Pseudobdellovibrionaceae bacterium]